MTLKSQHAKKPIELSNPLHLLATGFGSGMFYWMPGTVGSLVAILLWFLLLSFLPWPLDLLVVILSIFLGIYVCHHTACDIGVHDHSCIVWDEFIGMWLTLIALPRNDWRWVITGFLLFRFLDIWKPWPISWLDRKVQGGIGIIIDDVVASMIAAGILILLHTSGCFLSETLTKDL
ncbi:phosphatidylglycerophosphatase A [Candidatus Palibaumannia cicadellinicola]|uniref:Phosphatidylglycerophosphatase A n=1 Tax=Candidatus Palibaumannia cicadellinicola TaxID=186490 RepID=A0A088N2F8_9GAMM|nr:phosphatidylglycerophosphatase A [Candidatus Baumannia cicadellinicola]AIN47526.1 Phosphatidylglycerophosphatase A [Candidatus Baumannia cicadellinicola]